MKRATQRTRCGVKSLFRQFVGLLTLLLAFGLVSCTKKEAPAPILPSPVRAVQAVERDTPIYLISIGNIVSTGQVAILTQVDGQIIEAHFKEGDEVVKGAPLFTIDPRPYEAMLLQAQGALAMHQAQLKLAKDKLERSKDLATRDLISKQEYESLKTDVSALEASIQEDGGRLAKAQVNLDYCFIKSPVDGKTGIIHIQPGNIVKAASHAVLVEVQTMAPVYAEFTITEKQLTEVRVAMARGSLKMQARPQTSKGDWEEGLVTVLDNLVDTKTGTIRLRGTMPNAKHTFWPGQFIDTRVILEIKTHAVLVPAVAVRKGPKGSFVFVVQSGKATLRLVEVSETVEDMSLIASGVGLGEMVITSGQLGLKDGDAVTVEPDSGSGK